MPVPRLRLPRPPGDIDPEELAREYTQGQLGGIEGSAAPVTGRGPSIAGEYLRPEDFEGLRGATAPLTGADLAQPAPPPTKYAATEMALPPPVEQFTLEDVQRWEDEQRQRFGSAPGDAPRDVSPAEVPAAPPPAFDMTFTPDEAEAGMTKFGPQPGAMPPSATGQLTPLEVPQEPAAAAAAAPVAGQAPQPEYQPADLQPALGGPETEKYASPVQDEEERVARRRMEKGDTAAMLLDSVAQGLQVLGGKAPGFDASYWEGRRKERKADYKDLLAKHRTDRMSDPMSPESVRAKGALWGMMGDAFGDLGINEEAFKQYVTAEDVKRAGSPLELAVRLKSKMAEAGLARERMGLGWERLEADKKKQEAIALRAARREVRQWKTHVDKNLSKVYDRVYKANEKVREGAKEYGLARENAGLDRMDQHLIQIEDAANRARSEGSDIFAEGYNAKKALFAQALRGGALSETAMLGLTASEKELLGGAMDVFKRRIYDASGKQINAQEFDRERVSFGNAVLGKPEDVFNAISRTKKLYQDTDKAFRTSYDIFAPGSVSLYDDARKLHESGAAAGLSRDEMELAIPGLSVTVPEGVLESGREAGVELPPGEGGGAPTTDVPAAGTPPSAPGVPEPGMDEEAELGTDVALPSDEEYARHRKPGKFLGAYLKPDGTWVFKSFDTEEQRQEAEERAREAGVQWDRDPGEPRG